MPNRNFQDFLNDIATDTPEAKEMLHEFYMIMYNQPYSPENSSGHHGDPDDESLNLWEFFHKKYGYNQVRPEDIKRLHFVRRDVKFIGKYGPDHKY
jgi:hypothetical protein